MSPGVYGPGRTRDPNVLHTPVNLLREPNLDCGGLRFGIRKNRLTAEYIVQDFESITKAVQLNQVLEVASFPGRWRFRTIQSAGSHRVLLGGMIARLTAAARTAEPTSNKVKAVLSLFAVLLLLQSPSRVLLDAVYHQSKRYPVVYKPHKALLMQSIREGSFRPLVLKVLALSLDPIQ